MHALWINMDDSADRRDHMERMMAQLELPNERVPGIDARNWSGDQIDKHLAPNCKVRPKGGLLGNVLSHLDCWNIVSDRQNGIFFILEDDIVLSDSARSILLSETLFGKETDILRL
jgi:GR25 family glycosyltransferase involved in LPS biosynthesis